MTKPITADAHNQPLTGSVEPEVLPLGASGASTGVVVEMDGNWFRSMSRLSKSDILDLFADKDLKIAALESALALLESKHREVIAAHGKQGERILELESELSAAKERLRNMAQGMLRVRDALAMGDPAEAYHQLYQIPCPNFDSIDPWKELEELAGHRLASDAGQEGKKL